MFKGGNSNMARFKVFKISSLFFFVTLVLLMCSQLVYGELAIDFTLTDIDGNTFSLSDFQGKVVILDFFARYCPPCREEMSHLKTVQDEFGSRLVVVSISVWVDDTDENLRQFRDEFDITWIVARDTEGLRQKYEVTTLPGLFIVDQEGYIGYHHVGLTESSVLAGEVSALLARLVSLTVTTSPSISGVHFRVDGKDAYTSEGSFSVELEYGQHQVEVVDTLVREGDDVEHRFSSWSGIGSGSSNPVQIDIKASLVLQANFGTYHKIVFVQSGSEGTPHVTVDGGSYMLPQEFWFEGGSSHSFNYESPVSGETGIQYVLTSKSQVSPITVTGSATVTGYYETQYQLNVDTNPSGLSPQPDVSPFSLWYDAGTTVTCTAQAVNGYDFDYWILDGVPQEDGNVELTITIDNVHNATANYTATTDLNLDGRVDDTDVSIIVGVFSSEMGEEGWNPRMDFDDNGVIDIFDIVKVVGDFEEKT